MTRRALPPGQPHPGDSARPLHQPGLRARDRRGCCRSHEPAPATCGQRTEQRPARGSRLLLPAGTSPAAWPGWQE